MYALYLLASRMPDGMRLLRDGEADPAINLAVSVNSPNDMVRNTSMPVDRRYDMTVLKEAMHAYCRHPRRRILAEYVLIAGKTDSLENANELAAYLRGLRLTLNLIPYNPQLSSLSML